MAISRSRRDLRGAHLVVTGIGALTTGLGILALVVGCASPPQPALTSDATARLAQEVERLRAEVAVLTQRLEADRRTASTAASCSSSASRGPDDRAIAPTAEAELRNAQRALVRVIERLKLSPESKRELVLATRPARPLDVDNPWVTKGQPDGN